MNIIRKLSFIHFIIIAFFVLDIALVILHFSYGQQINYFNIDLEKNLPTLYQGFKLIVISSVIAAILVIIYLNQKSLRFDKLALVPYWLSFVYLALDELAEVHENFPEVITQLGGDAVTSYPKLFVSFGFTSAQWLLFFIPFMAVALVYLLYIARYLYKQNTGRIYILVLAIICFTLVPIIEYWNTSNITNTYSFNERNSLVVLEEYMEMLGATLFLTFNLILLRAYMNKIRQSLTSVKEVEVKVNT